MLRALLPTGLLPCLLVLGPVLTLLGCQEEVATDDDGGPGCLLDADCAPGELCMDGACGANPDPDRCTSNGDCEAGFVCRDAGCEAPAASGDCASDADCDRADRCSVADGDCLPSAACANAEDGVACDDGCHGNCVDRPACDGDDDCAPTEQCDPTDLVCLPIGDCDADDDCPVTASCVAGQCTANGDCTVDGDCPITESCVDDTCTRNDSCDSDAECPADQRCSLDGVTAGASGRCERRDPCSDDDGCSFDERCVDGTCNVIGDCVTVDDCPVDPGIACLDGTCTRAPCGRDADCDDGLFCTGVETCNPRVGCADGTPPATVGLAACASESCDESRDVVVVVGHDDRCADASPCTDDVCDTGLGCLHPANTFTPDPGPVGDCERTVCLNGVLTDVDADDEAPADAGSAGDCLLAVCRFGDRTLIPNDAETPVDPGTSTDCETAVCRDGARVLIDNDDEVPLQGPANDCSQQICQRGNIVTVAKDSEVPPQGPANDCDREICRSGRVVTVDADDEVPPQGPLTDCVRNVCVGGSATTAPDNAEVPLQGPNNDCKAQQCNAGVVVAVNNDSETPTQGPTNDCKREVCSNGTPTQVGNTGETPPQRSTTDCTTQTCSSSGTVVDVAAAETPPQRSTTDCTTQTCSGGAVVDVAANGETPPQASTTDCKTQVCSGGVVVAQNNDGESPADVGCKDGRCQGGVPSTVPDNSNCTDTEVCTVGSCNVDGTCSQTPQDNLCGCSAGQTGLCRPADPRAPNSGNLAGCVCLTPANLTCGLDAGELSAQRVLERFELNASAPGAQAGSTFTWDLVGVPTGADPAAQLLGNPTSATTVFFQATTPSAPGVRDYRLRVTLQEPDLPAKTCDVLVEATKIPDTLEVTLFMNAALDVDLHLIGGAGSSQFDFPFHDLHDPSQFGDNPNRSCYWQNCPVCSVAIPNQTCTAVSPRIVDFDDPVDGANLTDLQDPQLDIDNRRGCFTAANGDLQCIPEKITVETPDAGTYFVVPYLWGNPSATSPGLASTPSSTSVTMVIQCRGETRTITRTLSSVASGGGVAATDDRVRYGTPLFITIPATGACSLPVNGAIQ